MIIGTGSRRLVAAGFSLRTLAQPKGCGYYVFVMPEVVIGHPVIFRGFPLPRE